jgi:hypothetical protein
MIQSGRRVSTVARRTKFAGNNKCSGWTFTAGSSYTTVKKVAQTGHNQKYSKAWD